ncbi:MAG: ATP-binding cassette domain-containing protein [Oscillospiraceae bacterium]|nr:ATP-binding cassette domain-containing protein [Oscillospiraceae bacterium]
MNIIEVKGLKKSYGSVNAVRELTFGVEQGSLFAFLGPNGAGKSTTIDILCTLLKPDEGEVNINGYRLGIDDGKIRSSIGVVFQESLLDKLLSVKENLFTRGGFYGLSSSQLRERVNKAAAASDVTEFIDHRYGKLSGGQRRRADIARALINSPKILFLDEPTTGLDPQTRKSVWNTIRQLQKKEGVTVFLTTHYMEEAEVADYVVIINEGVISAHGTPVTLKRSYGKNILRLYTSEREALSRLLEGNKELLFTEDCAVLTLDDGSFSALPIIDKCRNYISGFEVIYPSMDDVFISVTGKEIKE